MIGPVSTNLRTTRATNSSNVTTHAHQARESVLFGAVDQTKFSGADHRSNFSKIPKDVLSIIGDFLAKEDVLNKMLPLSKEIFAEVMNDRFKLRIPTRGGHILEIGYKEFLENQIRILKERKDSSTMIERWTKGYYSATVCITPIVQLEGLTVSLLCGFCALYRLVYSI